MLGFKDLERPTANGVYLLRDAENVSFIFIPPFSLVLTPPHFPLSSFSFVPCLRKSFIASAISLVQLYSFMFYVQNAG